MLDSGIFKVGMMIFFSLLFEVKNLTFIDRDVKAREMLMKPHSLTELKTSS